MEPKRLSTQEVEKFLNAFNEHLDLHEAHTWEQVGRCVYCADCQERLYQGYLPKDRRPQKRAPSTPKATREMRQRWGMDD